MSLFPFSREGRQTLIYLVLAGCGPSLTVFIWWDLIQIRDWKNAPADFKLEKFASLSFWLFMSLLVIVLALACFVSIRAVKIGRDGIEAESNGNGNEQSSVTVTASAKVTPAPAGGEGNA